MFPIKTMPTILHKDIKMSPCKDQKKPLLFASSVEKQQNRCQVFIKCIQTGTLLNHVFSNEKKFDIQQPEWLNLALNCRQWYRDGYSKTRSSLYNGVVYCDWNKKKSWEGAEFYWNDQHQVASIISRFLIYTQFLEYLKAKFLKE